MMINKRIVRAYADLHSKHTPQPVESLKLKDNFKCVCLHNTTTTRKSRQKIENL